MEREGKVKTKGREERKQFDWQRKREGRTEEERREKRKRKREKGREREGESKGGEEGYLLNQKGKAARLSSGIQDIFCRCRTDHWVGWWGKPGLYEIRSRTPPRLLHGFRMQVNNCTIISPTFCFFVSNINIWISCKNNKNEAKF